MPIVYNNKTSILSLLKFSLTETVDTLATAIGALVTRKRTISPFPSRCTSESINDRHKFVDRDRSLDPVVETDDTDNDDVTLSSSNYKGLAGIKLPKFHERDADDVNT